jgi:hypothetical protein
LIVIRLRHTKSGAIVSVPEEKAERLGSEWEPAEKPVTAKRGAGRPKKSDS